jgi:hypothetical protein
MQKRSLFGALLLAGLAIPLTSCGTDPDLTSIAITPGSVTTSDSAGLQVQFIAVGSYTRPGHTPVTKDLSNQVTWTSAFPQLTLIDGTGLATVTGEGWGTGVISAAAPGFHGVIVGTANFVIQQPPTQSASVHDVTSLVLVPRSAPVGVQFTAVGHTQDGTTIALASQPKWTSTDNMVATIDAASGLASRVGSGTSRISAVYTNPDGTQAVGVTRLNVAPSSASN